MEEGRFDSPVRVITSENGGVSTYVTSARQAAEVLMYQWHGPKGPKHLAARKACLRVLEGMRRAKTARKALIEAAKESDLLMDD